MAIYIYACITVQGWSTVVEMRAAVGTVGVRGIIGKDKGEYDIRRRKCEERPLKAPRTG